MRLARLELYGFKSFPDRTTFHFGGGISCVVGPNGSGKSNVVDALKWCVGEQSAKSLRGAEMSDVIFAGSEDRKPVGFAEVVLTLMTDAASPFPGDYAAMQELQVGRRLHRSGTSEYTINQNRVRRRDVIELLLDSGIGNDLYSFIEQGQVDKMISASPQERRSLVDEAAGISRYKARRDEAREHLEATAAQLDRAADVVDEMARHLRGLEAQVLRTAHFRRLGTVVRLGEVRLALSKHVGLAEERQGLRTEQAELRGNEQALVEDIDARERDLIQRREELSLVEHANTELRDRLADLDGTIREENASASLHAKRQQELRAEQVRADGEVALQQKRHAEALAEGETAAQSLAETAVRQAALAIALAQVRTRAAEATSALAACEVSATKADAAVRAALEARLAAEGQREDARRVAGERGLKAAALGTNAATFRADLVRANHVVQEADKHVDAAQVSVTAAESALETADAVRAEARAVEAGAKAALHQAEEAREAHLRAMDAARRAHVAALDRGRAWVNAVEQDGARRIRGTEALGAATIKQAEADGVAAVGRARKEAETQRDQRLGERKAHDAALRAEADSAVQGAAVAAAEARKASGLAHTEQARASAAFAAVNAELEVVRGQIGASTEVGSLVRSVVPEAVALTALASDGNRAAWVRRLGERAGLTVLRHPAQVLALAEARPPEASVAVLFWPETSLGPQDRVHEAADLGAALAGPWPASGEGFRVDAEGVVHLGPPSPLERAVAALALLEVRLEAADQASLDARKEAAKADGAAKAAEAHAEAAVKQRSESAAARERDMAALVSAEQDAVAAAEAGARATATATVEATRLARDAALDSLRAEVAATAAALRGTLDQATDAGPQMPETYVDAVGPARDALSVASVAVEAARGAREQVVEGGREAKQSLDRATVKREAAAAEVARVAAAITRCEAEIATLEAARAGLEAHVAERTATAATAAAQEIEAKAAADQHRASLGLAQRDQRTSAEEAARQSADEASMTERQAGLASRQTDALTRAQDARAAVERASAHAAALAGQAAAAAVAHEGSLGDAVAAREERGVVWDKLELEKQRLASLVEARDAAERKIKQIRTKRADLAQRIEAITARLAANTAEIEVLRSRIDDRYQVSLQQLLERLRIGGLVTLEVDPDVQSGITIGTESVVGVPQLVLRAADVGDETAIVATVDVLERARRELAALGEVNLAAPQEYKDLSQRHDELAAQRTDLEQSVEGIRAAIAKLNKLCRERFRETFDLVNGHFSTVYPRLVGGGNARLALTDEEDLLETGVDIFVQPPGKRLQNLQLLSGGEKAMTAIALLIALFRVKPSPFCVLDEVDAPLDEANGTRFNEMLREMALHSQFLVITHNRKTMECADTLYGITMVRPGVSRLVSVDLEAW